MLRLLSAIWIALAFTLFSGVTIAVAATDRGPPYTDAQFLELAKDRMPAGFGRADLNNWWSRAPDYLRKRVLNSPSEKWWPIILCNFQGFKPEGQDAGGADKCEKDAYDNSQHKKSFWSADGVWIGPSEACVKRDKRTQWGELICD